MRPSRLLDNVFNGRPSKSVLASNSGYGTTVCEHSADSTYVVFVESGAGIKYADRSGLKASTKSVFSVFGRRNPLQVSRAVVLAIAVFVIDLMASRTCSVKGNADGSVDVDSTVLSVNIGGAGRVPLDWIPLANSTSTTIFNSTATGHQVAVFEAGKRFPNLAHRKAL